MKIRLVTTKDLDEVAQLYRDTIISVNGKDYTKEQIDAWASTASNQEGWARRMDEQFFYAAVIDGKIVGFASMDKYGYFDLLYVHKNHQRQGIATALSNKIEERANELELDKITVQASITAKPFFEKQGYKVTGEKHKMVNKIAFTNTVMAKKLTVSKK